MDYVYVCRKGDNEELRYSIRSVLKNTNCKDIWLIGYKPDWYVGNFVPVEDTKNKFFNIQQCLNIIPQIEVISEQFCWMNDDFYTTKKMHDMTTYHGGRLADKLTKYYADSGSTRYTRIIGDTVNKLNKYGIKEPLDYDIHVPMVMQKSKLNKVVGITLAPRSMYGNIYKIGGEQIEDVKFYLKYNNEINSETGLLSTEDVSFDLVKEKLEKLFPKPSKYEKF